MENEIIPIQLLDIQVNLEKQENTLWLKFQKTLTNIKTEGDLLQIIQGSEYFAESNYKVENDLITMTYQLRNHSKNISDFRNEEIHLKLKILKNMYRVLKSSEDGHTLILHPNNIFVDDNDLPYMVYRGFQNKLVPLTQTNDELLKQYKSLVFYLLNNSYDFNEYYNGGLDLVKKTQFMEAIYQLNSIDEIHAMLDETLQKERQTFQAKNTTVSKRNYSIARGFGLAGSILFLLIAIPSAYYWISVVPYNQKMERASYQYAAKNYGNVISELENEKDLSKMPKTQKYMLAESYIQVEPMLSAGENRANALKSISIESDEVFTNFWINLGRDNYDEAVLLSKQINQSDYTKIALLKGIQILEKDTKISGDVKQQKLREFEESLKKLDEKRSETPTPERETPVTPSKNGAK